MFKNAEVARLIRKYLKLRGIKAKVSSNQKASTGAVKVELYDVDPKTYHELEAYMNHYRYVAHASLPVDDALAATLPKVQYLHISREFTDSVCQRALNYIAAKTNTAVIDYASIDFKATFKVCDDMQDTIGDILHKVLRGTNCYTFHFWDEA